MAVQVLRDEGVVNADGGGGVCGGVMFFNGVLAG